MKQQERMALSVKYEGIGDINSIRVRGTEQFFVYRAYPRQRREYMN